MPCRVSTSLQTRKQTHGTNKPTQIIKGAYCNQCEEYTVYFQYSDDEHRCKSVALLACEFQPNLLGDINFLVFWSFSLSPITSCHIRWNQTHRKLNNIFSLRKPFKNRFLPRLCLNLVFFLFSLWEHVLKQNISRLNFLFSFPDCLVPTTQCKTLFHFAGMTTLQTAWTHPTNTLLCLRKRIARNTFFCSRLLG